MTVFNHKLQESRFRDWVSEYRDQLYMELAAISLDFTPHIYPSTDWFSPEGEPSIAVPFYLADSRLKNKASKILGKVEGSNKTDIMKLFRHEAGHAFETAFNMKYSAIRKNAFGSYTKPYPTSYVPRPFRRDCIDYLGFGYGGSHPSEDLAETFAFYLEHGNAAFDTYRGNSLIRKKLLAVKKMIENSSRRVPKKPNRKTPPYHIRTYSDPWKEVALESNTLQSLERHKIMCEGISALIRVQKPMKSHLKKSISHLEKDSKMLLNKNCTSNPQRVYSYHQNRQKRHWGLFVYELTRPCYLSRASKIGVQILLNNPTARVSSALSPVFKKYLEKRLYIHAI